MGSDDRKQASRKRKKRLHSPDTRENKRRKKSKKRTKDPEHSKSKTKKKHKTKERSKKVQDVEKCRKNPPEIQLDIGPTVLANPTETMSLPTSTSGKRAMVPMTKEEYEKQQSVVRRVADPETGRMRLVKGDGEIIEEIVSKSRHKDINKQATAGDGKHFLTSLGL